MMLVFQMILYSILENKWKHKPGNEDVWLVFGSRERIQLTQKISESSLDGTRRYESMKPVNVY